MLTLLGVANGASLKSHVRRRDSSPVGPCPRSPVPLAEIERAEALAHRPEMVLHLKDIRLERRFDEVVPDVICRPQKAGSTGPVFRPHY
jgi:hypothetical protein